MVNPDIVRRFFYHAGQVQLQKEARDHARRDIKHQIRKVKELTLVPERRSELAVALAELEEKLDSILSNESMLIAKQKTETKAINQVTKKLELIEEQISSHTELEKSRSERFEKLEKDIESNVQKNAKEIVLMDTKISELKDLYSKVKESGKYDHERLEQIRGRLEEFTARLEKLKK